MLFLAQDETKTGMRRKKMNLIRMVDIIELNVNINSVDIWLKKEGLFVIVLTLFLPSAIFQFHQ
ncbi:hypothetical protein D770_24795 [Flammeovirgaceae bacterium 311]|nr:hypothetical protein D770_24795 [Flammeovirgaceae bacterium 311]